MYRNTEILYFLLIVSRSGTLPLNDRLSTTFTIDRCLRCSDSNTSASLVLGIKIIEGEEKR